MVVFPAGLVSTVCVVRPLVCVYCVVDAGPALAKLVAVATKLSAAIVAVTRPRESYRVPVYRAPVVALDQSTVLVTLSVSGTESRDDQSSP